jgi:tetratricopeptide (TPR) repeat protein
MPSPFLQEHPIPTLTALSFHAKNPVRRSFPCFLFLFIAGASGFTAQSDKPPQTPVQVALPGQPADAAVNAAKPDPDTPFAQAMDLYYAGNYPAALEKFTAATQTTGQDSAAAYAWLTRLQIRMGRPEEAENSAKKALELNKDLPTAQSAMGEVYYRQAKFTEAQEIFRKIVLTDKQDARAYFGLAKIYWATANYKSAKQVIGHAHEQDPRDPDVFWPWFRTLDPEQRLAALKAQLAMHPSEGDHQRAVLARNISALAGQEKTPTNSCKLTSKVDSTEAKLESLYRDPKHLGGYGVGVRLNDANSVLLIDTGAHGIVVTARVAQKAGLQRVVNSHTGGIGDQAPARGYLAFAKKVRIGELEFSDCNVDVIENARSLDEDGLIGTDIFEDFLVDLDFPKKALRLSPLPPLPDEPPAELSLHSLMPIGGNVHNRYVPEAYANFEKVYRMGHDLLLPTRINELQPKLFLLDTGGWDNMIAVPAAREASKVHSQQTTKVSGLSGTVKDVYKTDDITLTFGKFQQHRHDLLSFDLKYMSDDAGTEVSGILGFAMLWLMEIKLDYRDHLVDFHVDENRVH